MLRGSARPLKVLCRAAEERNGKVERRNPTYEESKEIDQLERSGWELQIAGK